MKDSSGIVRQVYWQMGTSTILPVEPTEIIVKAVKAGDEEIKAKIVIEIDVKKGTEGNNQMSKAKIVTKEALITELNEACEKAGLDQTWFDVQDVHEDNALGFDVDQFAISTAEYHNLKEVFKSVSERHGIPFGSNRSHLEVTECESETGATYWDFDWSFLPNER